MTVSKPRYGTFEDMPLGDELTKRKAAPMCGVLIFDLATGKGVEWLRLEGDVNELFTVELMPGVRCPMAVGPASEEFPETVTFDPEIEPLGR